MSNFIKSLFLGSIIFFGTSIFAETLPTFETKQVEVLENGIVRFEGSFNSHGIKFPANEQPETWFEFGTDRTDLRFATARRNRLPGVYLVSQGATRFQQGTEYYARAIIEYKGNTQRGDIISFNPFLVTPIILNTETTQGVNSRPSINVNNPRQNSASKMGILLQPPLNHSFNITNLSQEKSQQPAETESGKEGTDKKDSSKTTNEISARDQSDSVFQNSASNTDNGEIIRERGSGDSRNGSSNSLTASVNNSGAQSSFPAYLAFLSILIMVIIIVVLFRITQTKKQNLVNSYIQPINNDFKNTESMKNDADDNRFMYHKKKDLE
jgi:hypothetical protein